MPFLLTGPAGSRHSGRVKDAVPPSPDASLPESHIVYSKFETELQVRPDDIDMYQHVHSSRYMDYVLAARFDPRWARATIRCGLLPSPKPRKRRYTATRCA